MLKDFSAETFDVLILAGQSNAEGYGVGPTQDPCMPDERIWYMERNGTISVAAETVMGNETLGCFAFPFARAYIRAGLLAQSRKLLVLRTAVGGTGFRDRNWGLHDEQFLQMLEMTRTALDLNPRNRLVGLLWHQGEEDAYRRASYDEHYSNLMGLIRAVREKFCEPELPFVTADFVHHWVSSNAEDCEPVLRAMRDVCRDCGHGAFVETDGLLSNVQETGRKTQIGVHMIVDDVHFSRNALYQLAERMFEAYTRLTPREE